MKKQISLISMIVLFLTALFVWAEIARSPQVENEVNIYFLNVGQGDAILIQKGQFQILIDGGPDDSVLSEIGEIMPLYDRTIEIVILSHPHADHLVGLNQILDRYTIQKVYATGVVFDSLQYIEFLRKVKEKNISLEIPNLYEDIIPFDNSSLIFLWPGDKFREKSEENLNNTSMVEKFCYFDSCALLTGDLEKDGQEEMLANYLSPKDEIFHSDILKIPHHGSSNAANETFFSLVNPKYAVISVGADNQFGHPHEITLNLLKNMKIQVFRTDKDGSVKFEFFPKNSVTPK